MNTCEYIIYDKESKQLRACAKNGVNMVLPTDDATKRILDKRRTRICLCDEHREFFIDCRESYMFHKRKTKK